MLLYYETIFSFFLWKAISLIYRMKLDSFEVCYKLFDSLINYMLLYSAHIHSINFLNELEKIQLQFFKRVLILPQCTPN